MIDMKDMDFNQAFDVISKMFSSQIEKPTPDVCVAMLTFAANNLFRIDSDDGQALLRMCKTILDREWGHGQGIPCGPDCEKAPAPGVRETYSVH